MTKFFLFAVLFSLTFTAFLFLRYEAVPSSETQVASTLQNNKQNTKGDHMVSIPNKKPTPISSIEQFHEIKDLRDAKLFIDSISRSKDPKNRRFLISEAANDTRDEIRRVTAIALRWDSSPEATQSLLRLTQSDVSVVVRGTAVYALQNKAGSPEVKAALKNRLSFEQSSEVKMAYLSVLAEHLDRETEGFIVDFAQSSKETDLRIAALTALQKAKELPTLNFVENLANEEQDPRLAQAATEVILAMRNKLTPHLLEH